MREYEKLDKRIIVIDKDNGGISSARNAGMRVATGSLIAFIDSDDWIHPQYFESLLHAQQAFDSDLTIAKHQIVSDSIPASAPHIDPDGIHAAVLSIDSLLKMRFARNYVWGRLYRASLLQSHQFIEGVVFEDTPFNLLLLCRHEHIRIALIEEPLYFYYMRPSSIVHTASRLELLSICDAYYSRITSDSSDHEKRILMEESIKKLLTVRYEASLDQNREAVRRSNALLRKCLRVLLSVQAFPFKKKLQYMILAAFPSVYRQFRIKDDPTLLQWEKSKTKRC